jgi:vacuolar-type H+-ATPase subunit E/Vma4
MMQINDKMINHKEKKMNKKEIKKYLKENLKVDVYINYHGSTTVKLILEDEVISESYGSKYSSLGGIVG